MKRMNVEIYNPNINPNYNAINAPMQHIQDQVLERKANAKAQIAQSMSSVVQSVTEFGSKFYEKMKEAQDQASFDKIRLSQKETQASFEEYTRNNPNDFEKFENTRSEMYNKFNEDSKEIINKMSPRARQKASVFFKENEQNSKIQTARIYDQARITSWQQEYQNGIQKSWENGDFVEAKKLIQTSYDLQLINEPTYEKLNYDNLRNQTLYGINHQINSGINLSNFSISEDDAKNLTTQDTEKIYAYAKQKSEIIDRDYLENLVIRSANGEDIHELDIQADGDQQKISEFGKIKALNVLNNHKNNYKASQEKIENQKMDNFLLYLDIKRSEGSIQDDEFINELKLFHQEKKIDDKTYNSALKIINGGLEDNIKRKLQLDQIKEQFKKEENENYIADIELKIWNLDTSNQDYNQHIKDIKEEIRTNIYEKGDKKNTLMLEEKLKKVTDTKLNDNPFYKYAKEKLNKTVAKNFNKYKKKSSGLIFNSDVDDDIAAQQNFEKIKAQTLEWVANSIGNPKLKMDLYQIDERIKSETNSVTRESLARKIKRDANTPYKVPTHQAPIRLPIHQAPITLGYGYIPEF